MQKPDASDATAAKHNTSEDALSAAHTPNRWLTALAAVCVQICLGAAYGWSVFKNPLMHTEHWPETAVQLNFTLTLVFLGAGTILGGFWQDRVGPRRVATAAGLLYGTGYLIASFATAHHSLAGIYIGYGFVAGLAMGMGYICPIAALVKWFPDKRGLMTGVAVCGYGFGALVMSPIAAWEMLHYGVPATFATLGMGYLLIVVCAAQYFTNPPVGWIPAGWTPRTVVAQNASTRSFTLAEAARTWQFYLLLSLLFLNMSSGIMVISQASPMAEEMAGLSVLHAAGIVGVVSIFNGIGRLFWASISDYIGRPQVYLLLYLVQAGVFFALPHLHYWVWFAAALGLIGLCYGGGFGTMPSFAADYFGTQHLGAIYGVIMFAANLSAIPSPMMIAHFHQRFGSYQPAIHVITVVMLCAMILPRIARRPGKENASSPPALAAR
ncbi:MAG TPA: OFA family MFS transporter [Terracidiphilus sp.]|nr:OFA family MFS transporter [Terracidiphilus sp.]